MKIQKSEFENSVISTPGDRSDGVRPRFKMVDRPEQQANTARYLHSFEFFCRPFSQKPKNLQKMYLSEGLSANQIAENLGVSKTFVIDQLHAQGIRKSFG